MKILLARGNPRKTGATQILADLLLSGMRDAGAEVFDFNVSEAAIKPCRGCFACKMSAKNECVIEDAMREILPAMQNADLIVCATPLYFYSMSAQMKIFWDRCMPLVFGYKKSENALGWENKTSLIGRKKFAAITVGMGGFNNSFDAAKKTWETLANAMGLSLIANVCRGESHYLAHPNQKLGLVERVKEAFYNLGGDFAKGFASPKNIEAASAPLSESEDVFLYNSDLFWARLNSRKNREPAPAKNSGEILKILRESFEPSAVKSEFVFEIFLEDLNESLALKASPLGLEPAAETPPDLRLSAKSGSLAAFLNKSAKPLEQLSRGEISVSGDMHLFARLGRIFGRAKG
ncbi:MAG: NAD(P)H-dependent oxidoreductase [Opitutales bacterium]|nr:NAD(P)H-dependent oxidoreductase [Opitutales bacterium]